MRRSKLGCVVLAPVLLATACAGTRTVGERLDDATITSKVKSKLVADPQINPFEIDVDTRDGFVRLSGTVKSDEVRSEAEKLARKTRGVRGVENQIRVGEPTVRENLEDATIGSKIKAKLAADPQVNSFHVDVDVVRGVVTLTGRVSHAAAKAEAERLARSTKGVKEVENLIQVVSRAR